MILKVDFFLYFFLYAIFVGWKSYASLASLIMNGHYYGHYTTNNIEGKITECWLVNEEGNFSYMTWRWRGQNFSIFLSVCLETAYALKKMFLKSF